MFGNFKVFDFEVQNLLIQVSPVQRTVHDCPFLRSWLNTGTLGATGKPIAAGQRICGLRISSNTKMTITVIVTEE